jgi:adenine-specific DNA-methyltransferase
VLTGYNEAFIIDGNKKDELIESDPKSEEIIRPILRGRDIKRYGYEYQDLWLIATFPSLKLEIESYQAVKQHLLSYGYDRLKQTGDIGARKKTNNKWFETQDSISYWEDFYKQKIVWGNLNLGATYSLAEPGIFVNAPCSIITPAKKYLLAILNSKVADYYIRSLGVTRNGGYFEYKPMFIEKLPIPVLSEQNRETLDNLIDKLTVTSSIPQKKKYETEIDDYIFTLYELTKEEIELLNA